MMSKQIKKIVVYYTDGTYEEVETKAQQSATPYPTVNIPPPKYPWSNQPPSYCLEPQTITLRCGTTVGLDEYHSKVYNSNVAST